MLASAIKQPEPKAFGSRISLRYGENAHQAAHAVTKKGIWSLAGVQPLQGKKLSYNNLLDMDAALFSLRCLVHGEPKENVGATIIKHTTPCGAAIARSTFKAFDRAWSSDELSAFGGIVCLSSEVDEPSAQALKSVFVEVIIAPSFSRQAREILAKKKNLRLIAIEEILDLKPPQQCQRSIWGGTLFQDADWPLKDIRQSSKIVTKRAPTESEWRSLEIGYRMSIPVKSNAIVLANAEHLIGVGAGQTSRVDAVMIAIMKAERYKHSLNNAALASDAFFPFADSIELASKAGITAIVQPGGSIRDKDVIEAANAQDLAMIFTNKRHFRH